MGIGPGLEAASAVSSSIGAGWTIGNRDCVRILSQPRHSRLQKRTLKKKKKKEEKTKKKTKEKSLLPTWSVPVRASYKEGERGNEQRSQREREREGES